MKPTPHDQAVATAMVVPEQAQTQLQKFWKANSKQIAAVTAGADTERIMRVTYSLLYRTPKLVECTPFSLLNGIVLAHQMGLVFGTQEVALVPFGKEATIIIQYQGKIKLALASQLISSIHTETVVDDEPFEYEVSQNGVRFYHKPKMRGRAKPTEENVIAAYCQLQTSSGGVQTKVISLDEILDARNRSRGYRYQLSKGGSDNPWFTDFGAMALKTAVHRAMKNAPQDARLGLANSIDDEDQGGASVIADGLNPSEFSVQDLQEPLLEISAGAQAAIVEQKTGVKVVTDLPDPIPLTVGTKMSRKGVTHMVVDSTDGHTWQPPA